MYLGILAGVSFAKKKLPIHQPSPLNHLPHQLSPESWSQPATPTILLLLMATVVERLGDDNCLILLIHRGVHQPIPKSVHGASTFSTIVLTEGGF